MRVRFKGDGALDGEGRPVPCVVFGHVFPVGEWIEHDEPRLARNPMFETEGAQPAPSLDALRANLDRAGATYDRRWGARRLQAAVDAMAEPKTAPADAAAPAKG